MCTSPFRLILEGDLGGNTLDDALSISKVSEEDVDDCLKVMGFIPILRQLVRATSGEAIRTYKSVQEDAVANIFKEGVLPKTHKGDVIPWSTPETLFAGSAVIEMGVFALDELAAFVLDRDEDDDDWSQSQFSRQGLLQDLEVLDMVVDTLQEPIRHIKKEHLNKSFLPELQEGTGIASDANGLWDNAFKVLHNSALGDETASDRFIARYYKVFVDHMLFLKTEGASEVLIELFQDNRDALDDLLDGVYAQETNGDKWRGAGQAVLGKGQQDGSLSKNAGLQWVLAHSTKSQKQDLVDHDYYNFLSALCVCKKMAVRRSQQQILTSLGFGKFNTDDGSFVKATLKNNPTFEDGLFLSIEEVKEEGRNDIQLVRRGQHCVTQRSFRTFRMKGSELSLGLIREGTQESDEFAYWESNIEDSDGQEQYDFLCSNLNICASLCDGHFVNPTNLVNRFTNNAPEVLINIVMDYTPVTTGVALHKLTKRGMRSLPYKIRALTLKLLMEMYLETSGAVTVLNDGTLELVYVLLYKKDKPGIFGCTGQTQDQTTSLAQTQLDSEQNQMRRQNNQLRKAYILGSQSEEDEYHQIAGNDVHFPLPQWSGKIWAKGDKFVYKEAQKNIGLSLWITAENGFRHDLRSFSREMRRLNLTQDNFEPWHKEHGEFLLRVFDQMYFSAESGYYFDQNVHIVKILAVVVEDLLYFSDELLLTEAGGTSKEDGPKIAMITDVLDRALSVIELVEIQQQSKAMSEFIDDFVEFERMIPSKNRTTKRSEHLRKIWDTAKVKVVNNGDSLKAWNAPYIPREDWAKNARDYVDSIHDVNKKVDVRTMNCASLVCKGFEITAMMKNAFQREQKYYNEFFILREKHQQQSKAQVREMRESVSTLPRKASSAGGMSLNRESMSTIMSGLEQMEDKDYKPKPAMKQIDTLEEILLLIARNGKPQENSNIVRRSMKMLTSIFRRRHRMFENLSKLRIIESEAFVEVYNQASEVLTSLHYQVYDSQIDQKTAPLICAEISKLNNHMLENGTPQYSVQQVLFRMNFLDITLGIFDQDLNDKDYECNDLDAKHQPKNTVILCMRDALNFVGNLTLFLEIAQDRMFDEMPGLLTNPRIKSPAVIVALAHCLIPIFKESPKFQIKVRESHLQSILTALKRLLQDEALLKIKQTDNAVQLKQKVAMINVAAAGMVDLLIAIIEPRPGSLPIARNQGLVMTVLMEHDFITDLQTSPGTNNFVLKFTTAYDISIIRLLATLADGGQVSLIESINKKLFKLDDVLVHLNQLVKMKTSNKTPDEKDMHLKKLNTLLSFFVSTYLSETCVQHTRFPLNIFVFDPSEKNPKSMWPLLDHCITVFENLQKGKGALGQAGRRPFKMTSMETTYTYTTLMRFLQCVFSRLFPYFTATSQLEHVSKPIECIDRLGAQIVSMTTSLDNTTSGLTLAGIKSAMDTCAEFNGILAQLHVVLKPDRSAARTAKARTRAQSLKAGNNANTGAGFQDKLYTVVATLYLTNMEACQKGLAKLHRQRARPHSVNNPQLPRTRQSMHRREDLEVAPQNPRQSIESAGGTHQSARGGSTANFKADVLLNETFGNYVSWMQNQYGGSELIEFVNFLDQNDSDASGALSVGKADKSKIKQPPRNGYKLLLRYLGFLETIMVDVGATDDDKEEATRLAITT